MIAAMNDIWKKTAEALGGCGREGRKIFVDLADPEKRTSDDVREAMKGLSKLQETADVILGLNLKESTTIAAALGFSPDKDPLAAIEETAAKIRRKLELSCVVIHPRQGAAAATAQESAQFAGPFVQHPKISTGAGDHFNAGFCLGRVLDFSLSESLCTGVGTSGYYVRNAASPSAKQLAEFVDTLPAPEK